MMEAKYCPVCKHPFNDKYCKLCHAVFKIKIELCDADSPLLVDSGKDT